MMNFRLRAVQEETKRFWLGSTARYLFYFRTAVEIQKVRHFIVNCPSSPDSALELLKGLSFVTLSAFVLQRKIQISRQRLPF